MQKVYTKTQVVGVKLHLENYCMPIIFVAFLYNLKIKMSVF